MLSPYMKKLQNNRKSKEIPSPIQSYNGQNLLLMTPLVQLYLKLGLKVSKITKVIQYVPGKGLLPFANKVVQLRSEATKDGDDAKQLTAKLYGNAGYGKQAEQVSRHRDTRIYTDLNDVIKDEKSPFFRQTKEVIDENGDLQGYLVTKTKQKVTDNLPVHIGVAILQWSKYIFIDFMYFLEQHLIEGSFKTVYADTDSMVLALTQTIHHDSLRDKLKGMFDPIVKPSMKPSWEQKWENWFVTTNEIHDIRKPGKLKMEFDLNEGRFISLSPKSYHAIDKKTGKIKSGHKGVSNAEAGKLSNETYVDCLYNNTEVNVMSRTFQKNKQQQLQYVETSKRGLNPIFKKFRVQEDKISCLPLCKNGKYL